MEKVRVVGFCWIELEQKALYVYEQDYMLHLYKNGIWLDLEIGSAPAKNIHGQYALVEGVFGAKQHGHMGMFSGALTSITRTMPWMVPPSKQKPRR